MRKNEKDKKKEIRIVRETDVSYTFIDTELIEHKEDASENSIKTYTEKEKEILRSRAIDSKKSKIRHRNRIAGGQTQQSHSSVYE